ncbi:calcium-binding protein [Hyphococcus flavus]|uniref:Calcium-binding protein n=1 Tax=Hyphococcus flavus TaxID=1866326 RepID=A0AAF0CC36_9PROT|nr:calcium-binding protein [Hyphococcus flavus]WDI32470.1 calcium-binding protein [Hyphococcus flavus]
MATLTVTTLDDEAFDGGETVGSPDGAGLSLREALELAQDGDTITFDNGLSDGTLNITGPLTINQDDLLIDGDLDDDGVPDITIASTGSGTSIIVEGGSESDPLDITLQGLTLNGAGYEGSSGLYSGGDHNLTVEDSAFLNFDSRALFINSASSTLAVGNSYFYGNYSSGNGGAIYGVSGSIINVQNSRFASNEANVSGGAIASLGDVYVSDTDFEGNTATQHGAGIAHFSGDALEILSSTFDNNVASGFAGGVFATGDHTYIYNTTFSDNASGLSGGGLFLGVSAIDAEVVNSTFYSNHSGQTGGGLFTDTDGTNIVNSTFTGNSAATSGGGIANVDEASIGNSIVAGNRLGGAGATVEIDSTGGTTTYSGVNIFTNQTGGIGDGDDLLVSDLSTVFASLVSQEGNIYGALADNGGPVQTVAIAYSGVAVDAGNNNILPADVFDFDDDLNTAESLPVDARGFARVVGGVVDIGAYELDLIAGTSGNDSLPGTGNADLISGFAGNDTLNGGAGDDTLDGGDDNDFMLGNDDNDSIIGGGGNDSANGNDGDDELFGNQGDDLLVGSTGNDTIDGGAGLDVIYGGDGEDMLMGGSARDVLAAGVKNDILDGGGGRDELYGGANNDLLMGGDGNDTMFGAKGVDTLEGGDGNDTVSGAADNDFIDGGEGDDLIFGGVQNDLLTGGLGNDTFLYNAGNDIDVITDFVAGAGTEDVIELNNFGTDFDTFAEVMAAATDDGADTTINFGSGNLIILYNVVVADLHQDDFVFG